MALVPGPGLRARVHDTARAEAVLGVGVGGLVFAFLYVNLRIAQRGLVPNPLVVQFSAGAPAVDVTRLLRRLACRRRSAWRCCSAWAPPAAGLACSSSCTARRRCDGPCVRPRRGLLRVHGASDRGRNRSLYRRHDAHAARDHHAVRAAPGHRRVPAGRSRSSHRLASTWRC